MIYFQIRDRGWLPFKKSLKDEHVYITGAGNGLGRKLAQLMSQQGANITCVDLDLDSAKETVRLIQLEGGQALALRVNVTSAQEVIESGTLARNTFGPVTILINNAGIANKKKTLDTTDKDIRRTFDVNVISHGITVKEFLPDMLKLKKGHIVSISSMAGVVGIPGLGDYSGSKFAAFGFDESLRLEMKKMNTGVKTTCVCPFFINTGMFDGVKTPFPLLYMMELDWVAKRIINGIRQEEAVLLLPAFANLLFLGRAVLPVSVFDRLMTIVGATVTMDDIQGSANRKQKLKAKI